MNRNFCLFGILLPLFSLGCSGLFLVSPEPVPVAGSITRRGKALTLRGNAVSVGQGAPDFALSGQDLETVRLADTRGVRIFVSVPSLDTSVCDLEGQRFNEEAAGLPGVSVYIISMDLPFAQRRWCGAHGIERVVTLSDYRQRSFARNWGVDIEELGLLARAVFVVDAAGVVVYREVVPELGQQPDFAAALAAARAAVGSGA